MLSRSFSRLFAAKVLPKPSSLANVATESDPQLGLLNSAELARAVVRATREGRSDATFWRAIARRTSDIFPEISEKELAIILHGFGKFRVRDKILMTKISENVATNISAFSAASLCSILACFARLEFPSDLLFNAASRHLSRISHQLISDQVSLVFFAYSALGYRHPTLFKILGKNSVARLVGKFEPRHLASLCASTAALGESEIFPIVASEIAKNIDQFTARQITGIFLTYQKHRIGNEFMLELLVDQSFRKRSEFSPREYSLVLNAMADLEIPNAQVLVDYWTGLAEKDVRKFPDISSLAALAAALTKVNVDQEKRSEILEAIGNRVNDLSHQLTPRHLASLVHAFGKARHLHGGFFSNAPGYAAQHLSKFTLDEISMVVGGLARLDIQNEALLIALFKELPARLEGERNLLLLGEGAEKDDLVIPVVSKIPATRPCSKHALLVLLDMMGRFYISEEPIFRKILHTLSLRMSEISPNDISRVLKAAVALQHASPELQKLLQEKFSDEKWLASCDAGIQEKLKIQLADMENIFTSSTLVVGQ